MVLQDPDDYKQTGWQNKALTLVHMHLKGSTANLKFYLDKLSEHHALQRPLAKLSKAYHKEGVSVYKKYIEFHSLATCDSTKLYGKQKKTVIAFTSSKIFSLCRLIA